MSALGADNSEATVEFSGGARMVLAWASVTDTGNVRQHNEDSYLARIPIFAVADGLGGHAAGDFASARVVARLAELGDGPVEFDDVDTALARATEDILPVAAQSPRGVGTTVTGVVLTTWEERPYWVAFNIGDSRCYLLYEGQLHRVTVDHSVVQQLVDAGLITADEAETHPDSNVITRAVGFEEAPQSDKLLVQPTAGMRILVCSDGLTKEINDAAIAQELSAGRNAADTVAQLRDRALSAQGRDNVTVIVVDVLSVVGLPEYPAPAPASVQDSNDDLSADTAPVPIPEAVVDIDGGVASKFGDGAG